MAGTITHSWNGTVLTITSDSGTSSADLKGATGDMGIRGAQGAPGVVYDAENKVLSETYATREYCNNKVDSIDFSPYATVGQVNALAQTITNEVLAMANICYISSALPTADLGKDGDICLVTG